MADLLLALLAVAVPTAVGIAAVAMLLGGTGRTHPAFVAGAGFLVGVLVVAVAAHAVVLAGAKLRLPQWSLAVLVIGAVLGVCGRLLRARLASGGIAAPPLTLPFSPGLLRVAAIAALGLLALRALSVTLEAAVTPLFPWDAWSQWATKARVWWELGTMVPFVGPDEWLAAGRIDVYTDTNPAYPGGIPLFQAWAAAWLGWWNDSLVNLAWPAAFVALATLFYGAAREAGVDRGGALVFTYLFASTPIVSVHTALAGYADLFMAYAFGAAAMALALWSIRADRRQLVLAILFAAGCVLIKRPGLAWAAAIAGAVVARMLVGRLPAGRVLQLGIAVAAIGAVAGALLLLSGSGSAVRAAAGEVAASIAEHTLQLANWHLFWYVAVALVVVRYRAALVERLLPLTLAMLFAVAFLGVVFFFGESSISIVDGTTINRALLHIVPALAFFLMLLCAVPVDAAARGEPIGGDDAGSLRRDREGVSVPGLEQASPASAAVAPGSASQAPPAPAGDVAAAR